jgi:hypothetical protein
MKKSCLLTPLLFVQMEAIAQFGLLKKVVDVAVSTTIAPAQSIIGAAQVVQGGNVNNIYKPYVNVVNQTGGAVSATATDLTQVQNDLFQKAQQFVQNTTGNTGAFIFDLGTFTNQYATQLASSAGQTAGAILQGENVFQITAAPLAAAIRAANVRYSGVAMSIPDDVKQALQNYFPASVLNDAKYAVGSTQITLPNFIGQGQAFFGNDYAVTVNDIIVFNTDPGSYASHANWWAHELTHVLQYQRWGIEKFAYLYIKDLGSSIESEAVNNAARITNQAQSRSTFQQAASYDMSNNSFNPVSNQVPEIFVAQCFFSGAQSNGVNFLVTNYGRLIGVDPVRGTWLHYGYAVAPRFQGFSWTYQTATVIYDVNLQGQILMPQPRYNQFGQQIGIVPVQVGEVRRL